MALACGSLHRSRKMRRLYIMLTCLVICNLRLVSSFVGMPFVSPKGDSPGFVKAIHSRLLIIPDRPGVRVRAHVCGCVCKRECERARDRERVCVCVREIESVGGSVGVYGCTCVHLRVRVGMLCSICSNILRLRQNGTTITWICLRRR